MEGEPRLRPEKVFAALWMRSLAGVPGQTDCLIFWFRVRFWPGVLGTF